MLSTVTSSILGFIGALALWLINESNATNKKIVESLQNMNCVLVRHEERFSELSRDIHELKDFAKEFRR
jgi:uncharacterized protein (DUF342 family)